MSDASERHVQVVVTVNDRWRVTSDGRHWVLQQKGDQGRWNVGQVYKRKVDLLRDIQRRCGKVSWDALAKAAALPERPSPGR